MSKPPARLLLHARQHDGAWELWARGPQWSVLGMLDESATFRIEKLRASENTIEDAPIWIIENDPRRITVGELRRFVAELNEDYWFEDLAITFDDGVGVTIWEEFEITIRSRSLDDVRRYAHGLMRHLGLEASCIESAIEQSNRYVLFGVDSELLAVYETFDGWINETRFDDDDL